MLEVPQFVLSVQKSAKQYGSSFATDAPKIWNDLPVDVHSVTSLLFEQKLTSYLFAKTCPPFSMALTQPGDVIDVWYMLFLV